MQRPRRFLKSELKRVRVILEDSKNIRLECEKCGQVWSPNLKSGGRLPKGYWKCPNRCNVE